MNKPNLAKLKKSLEENYLPISIGLLGLGTGVLIATAAFYHDYNKLGKVIDEMGDAYLELANFAVESGLSKSDVFEHALKNNFFLIPNL